MLDIRAVVEAYFRDTFRPSSGEFNSIGNLSVSAADQVIAFDGTLYDEESGPPRSSIAIVEAGAQAPRMIGPAGRNAVLPKWSPDGETLGFLSDAGEAPGVFALWTAPRTGLDQPVKRTSLAGYVVESFDWSPSGSDMLVQAAPFGAGRAGAAGGTTIAGPASGVDWEPVVLGDDVRGLRRQAWILGTGDRCDKVEAWAEHSVWEAVWCGPDTLAAILSENPMDGGWYDTHLSVSSLGGSEASLPIHARAQFAGLAASPDGRYLALLTGRFHRLLGAGKVLLLDLEAGKATELELPDADISSLVWRSDGRLLFSGLQSMGTIVGHIDPVSASLSIDECGAGPCGGRTPMVWPFEDNATIRVASDYHRPQRIEVRRGDGTLAAEIAPLAHDAASPPGNLEQISWPGRDGLAIEGLLVTPDAVGPHPLVVFIHGGPVATSRPIWTLGVAILPLLVKAGFAIFLPNPRGSLGRGASFSGRVIGDFAGEDIQDILAGVDHLLEQGVADPGRLALLGGSYGGYLTTVICGMSERFKAAVAISPITHLRSQYFTAHHPEFLDLYVGASPYETGGTFDARSPLMNASAVRTPMLLLAGALDNTTPASQAREYFEALRLCGSRAELVVYPREGHGIPKRYEAHLDHAVRAMDWICTHVAGRL